MHSTLDTIKSSISSALDESLPRSTRDNFADKALRLAYDLEGAERTHALQLIRAAGIERTTLPSTTPAATPGNPTPAPPPELAAFLEPPPGAVALGRELAAEMRRQQEEQDRAREYALGLTERSTRALERAADALEQLVEVAKSREAREMGG